MTDVGKLARVDRDAVDGRGILVIGSRRFVGSFLEENFTEDGTWAFIKPGTMTDAINAASDARLEAFRRKIVDAVSGLWITDRFENICTVTKVAAIKAVEGVKL